MPSFVRSHSLIVQLVVLVICPILLALVVAAYGGVSLHEHAMRDLVGARDTRAADAAANSLTDRFIQRRLLLSVLANSIAGGANLTQMLADQPELQRVFDGGLVVVGRQGNILDSWMRDIDWTASLRSATSPWVLEHDLAAPLVIANAQSANQQITLFGGISLVSLNVPGAMGILQSSPQTRSYVVADDLHIIDDSALVDVGKSVSQNHTLDMLFASGSKSPPSTSHGETDDVIVVSSYVDELKWTLVAQESWQALTRPSLRLSLIAPLAMIPAVLLAMTVLLFGVTRIMLPLQHLGQSSVRLAWGDYDSIRKPVGGVQEIRDLQQTLGDMAQRLQQAQAGMHSYIGAILQGQEDERRRLARELHDDTLQSLIALNQQRQLAQRALDNDTTKTSIYLEQLRVTIEQTSQNLRRLIRDMRPSYIEDLGLVPALEMLSTQNAEHSGIDIQFVMTGTPRRLLPNQELGLYRITQEAITNVIRHAEAHKIIVSLQFGTVVVLSIEDDGKGFAVPDRPGILAQQGHYGLTGMVERAEQIRAQFHLDSKSGKGTIIKVCVPLNLTNE